VVGSTSLAGDMLSRLTVFVAMLAALLGAVSVSAQPRSGPADVGALKNNDYFMSRHEAYKARAASGEPMGVLFMGDSITEYWKGQGELWEKYWGAYQPVNFAISGDLTQHVIGRIEDGELDGISPRVAVLMIGTNNTAANSPAEIVGAVDKIVTLTRTKLPHTKLILLGIIPRGPWVRGGQVDNWAARMAVIGQVNPGLKAIADADPMIIWLDMSAAFADENGLAREELFTDWLHPSAAGFEVWGEQMSPVLARLMAE